MSGRLPSAAEFGAFAVMALICALVVALMPRHDYALLFASMPLFFVSSVMGFRRSERLKLLETQALEPDKELT